MAAPVRPLTVALAGGSGSGKTTLAAELAGRLGSAACTVLAHDCYYRDRSHLPPDERAAANFDHPESLENGLLADHLAELRRGRSIARPDYDFSTHSRLPTAVRVEPRPVVFCEGILLLAAPELHEAFDVRIFLDVPADVRVLRRVERDVHARGRTVRSVADQYLATVRPMHERFVEPARSSADLVLGWRSTPAQWADAVLASLRRHRAELGAQA